MNQFDAALHERLAAIREQGLYRQLRQIDSPQSPHIEIAGKTLLNFSSNDYLGLANEPALKEAAIEAVKKFGSGSGASRLICGSVAPHHELEEALAAFKGLETALTFSTGYAAAVGTISAVVGKEDIVVIDKLVHASIVDGARLSGAKLRVFAHNDLNDLEEILKWADSARSGKRVLIITESVFSMDGDCGPLREIVTLKNKYGAWLMVDEAHATGLYGKNRRGLAEELGVSNEIEVQMGTLGKALGASGGYIAGSRTLIDYLVNRARSFIFSTAPVPAAAAAATAGIRFVQSPQGEERRKMLWERVKEFQSTASDLGSGFISPPTGGASVLASRNAATERPVRNLTRPHETTSKTPSAIIPIIIGNETKAVETAAALLEQNIYVPAIRYPTVARNQARLRVTMTAAHKKEDVAKFLNILHQLFPQ